MKYLLWFWLMVLTGMYHQAYCQSIEVDGPIVIGNDESVIPQEGAIRWNGKDFQGWNGMRWVSLTSHSNGIVYDIEGNAYRTVIIGDTEWMAENLRVTKFNDGSTLGAGLNSGGWQLGGAITTPLWGNVSYIEANKEVYGLLYNGYAIATSKNICPMGWHIPLLSDYDNLVTDLNSDVSKGGGLLKKRGEHRRWYWLMARTKL